MKIAIGSDHRGTQLKEIIKTILEARSHEIEDMGTFSTESVDYPDFAFKVAEAVSKELVEFGILICGSGIGMSIAANKVPNIRAALCMSPELARLSRLHNNANILVLGADYTDENTLGDLLTNFFTTQFEEARHSNRIHKITDIENKFLKK
jgi:ribose 5-phosphate isomerase B